jgi:hypothetical protein
VSARVCDYYTQLLHQYLPHNYPTWIERFWIITEANTDKIPPSVARFARSGNECIFARPDYFWGVTPYKNLDSLDTEEWDRFEIDFPLTEDATLEFYLATFAVEQVPDPDSPLYNQYRRMSQEWYTYGRAYLARIIP